MAQRNGTGMFPREVMNRFPLLPLEEEGRLNDMPLRENFIERVFAYYRWTRMLDEEPTPGGLVPGRTVQGRQVPHRAQADADGSQSEALHRDGPSRRRRGQAGLGGIDSRVWGHAHGGPRCDGHAGQACERPQGPAPAEYRFLAVMGYLKKDLSSEDKAYLR